MKKSTLAASAIMLCASFSFAQAQNASGFEPNPPALVVTPISAPAIYVPPVRPPAVDCPPINTPPLQINDHRGDNGYGDRGRDGYNHRDEHRDDRRDDRDGRHDRDRDDWGRDHRGQDDHWVSQTSSPGSPNPPATQTDGNGYNHDHDHGHWGQEANNGNTSGNNGFENGNNNFGTSQNGINNAGNGANGYQTVRPDTYKNRTTTAPVTAFNPGGPGPAFNPGAAKVTRVAVIAPSHK